jgi:membrane-bound lytic murein transglycosylase B
MCRYPPLFGLIVGLMFVPAFAQSPGGSAAEFASFLNELWPQAKARGIVRATFDAAFTGVTPDPRVIAAIDRQPEFNKPMGDYLAMVVAPGNIAFGMRKASQWAGVLSAVERRFGVDRSIIMAIWGLESSYGAEKDRWDLFRSLATLAEIKFRQPYFRDELLTALEILQDGHLTRDRLTSSWAGAMGQPQFMPSTFKKYAVDFSGNGAADIWTNVPDVFASTANYLHEHGWEPGVPWGFEVVVPQGFDYRRSRATFPEWLKLGVAPTMPPIRPTESESCSFRLGHPDPRSSLRIIIPSSSNTIIRTPTHSRSACLRIACAGNFRCAPPGLVRSTRFRACRGLPCRISSPTWDTR